MLKFGFYILFGIIAVLAGYLFWQNRASEKVVVTFWSTLTLGAMATFVTLLFSVKSESMEAEFLSIYTLDKQSKLPFVPRGSEWIRGYAERQTLRPVSTLIEEIRGMKPEVVSERDDFGIDAYRAIALCNVFDALAFAYGNAWDSKVSRFRIPSGAGVKYSGPPEKAEPSDFIGLERFQALFPKRPLGKPQPENVFTRFAVPKGSSVTSIDNDFNQELTLRNGFAQVKINLSYSFGDRGSDVLKDMLQLNAADSERIVVLGFVVTIKAKFNSLRGGHPKMPTYRRWVEGLIAELRETMESEKHWKAVSEDYLFRKRITSPSK